MIYYIIGGHGSGKSTAVNALLKERTWEPEFAPGRKAPLGYSSGKIFVAGRYDIKNGGTDTIRPLSKMVLTLRDKSKKGNLVIGEGVGQARFVSELVKVCKTQDIRVLALATDLKTCVSSVRKRGHKLSADGVKRSWIRSQNAAEEFRSAGVEVVLCSRSTLTVVLKEATKC